MAALLQSFHRIGGVEAIHDSLCLRINLVWERGSWWGAGLGANVYVIDRLLLIDIRKASTRGFLDREMHEREWREARQEGGEACLSIAGVSNHTVGIYQC